MSKGYSGKILRVDLSGQRIWTEMPGEEEKGFYRTYWGGSCLGTYYLLKEVPPGTDPLSPENLLVFAGSVASGVSAPGLAKYAVITKSPMTNGVGVAMGDGFWGPELKACGYDGIVISGKADKPLYLFIDDEKAELKDASHIWGSETGNTVDAIKAELRDTKVKVACIGPAGENLVRYASIISDKQFVNLRAGVGAVMGSKNLKAIAVRGTQEVKTAHPERVLALAKDFEEHFLDNPVNKAVHDGGTAAFLGPLNAGGLVTSCNGRTTHFEGATKVGEAIAEPDRLDRRVSCYSCPAACKRIWHVKDNLNLDSQYGAPELEPLMAFCNGCMVDDVDSLFVSLERCTRYGLDPISAAGTIAFAMECYENGILTKDQTSGLDLKFGNGELLPELIGLISYKKGIGALLAEGSKRAAGELVNEKAGQYAMEVKGLELPPHDGRTKAMLGLAYAVAPTGPDELSVEHDTDYDENAPELFMEKAATLGIRKRIKATGLTLEKVSIMCSLQQVFSFMDALCLCKFSCVPCRYYSFTQVVDLMSAISGWEVSLWELMRLGERCLVMQRIFNLRQGLGVDQDCLPDRMHIPVSSGPQKGATLLKDEFDKAKQAYYRLRSWDEKTGMPSDEKLAELDLEWLTDN